MINTSRILPNVVKNLMIINGLFFLASLTLPQTAGIDLFNYLGLFSIGSESFKPYQFFTHLFMHSNTNFGHIFSNMFMLWMFGSVLENVWGPKKFLTYYLITGLGAAFLHLMVNQYQIISLQDQVSPEILRTIINEGRSVLLRGVNYADPALGQLNLLYNIPTVGASGAVFGVLLAFGMLFPNTNLYLIFVPIPIKAKYFVMLYGAFELFAGFQNNDNIAHFAHLGGMLFGYILIKLWGKNQFRQF